MIGIIGFALFVGGILVGGTAFAQDRGVGDFDGAIKQTEIPGGVETVEIRETSRGVWEYIRRADGALKERRPATDRENAAYNEHVRDLQLEAVSIQLAALLDAMAASPSTDPEILQLQQALIALSKVR